MNKEQIDIIGAQTMKRHYMDLDKSKDLPAHLGKAFCGVTFSYNVRRGLICETCETKRKAAWDTAWLEGQRK